MTDAEFLRDERLVELAQLPDDHPDVRGVRQDPGRWARLVALRAFLSEDSPPPGARTAEAVAAIRRAVHEASSSPAASGATERGRRSEPRLRPAGSNRPWWSAFWGPALATAAVVVVAVVLVRGRDAGRPDAMRGPESATWRVHAATLGPETWRFAWQPVPGADLYEVTFMGEDLATLRPAIAVDDTLLILAPAEVLGTRPAPATLVWRVTAFRAGQVIAGSELERARVSAPDPGP